jgi:hypothetical protein
VFWLGVNPHQLWSARYTPASGWHGPALLASGLGSQPSPAVSGTETVNVFWKGSDGQLWDMSRGSHRSRSTPAAVAMGQIGAAPRATAQHSGEIDVFWGGAAPGSVWHGTYTPGSRWGSPQRAGGGMGGQLIVVGSAPSTESAFWKGQGGLLWRSTSQGAGWGPATAMPLGAIGTKLAAVGQSNGVVDVFWWGSNHHLWHSRFYPRTSSWTRPHDLGGACADRRRRWPRRAALPGPPGATRNARQAVRARTARPGTARAARPGCRLRPAEAGSLGRVRPVQRPAPDASLCLRHASSRDSVARISSPEAARFAPPGVLQSKAAGHRTAGLPQ